MAVVFERPHALTDKVFSYCPGCPHGIVHRLVAETIDELGIEGRTIGISPVGCSVTAYDFFACDMVEAAHGRAPAVATGIKRARPDNIVSPIRATATWPLSVWPRPFTPQPEVRTLPLSSSITPFTA